MTSLTKENKKSFTEKKSFFQIEKILDCKIQDLDIFKTAFTHRSYLNEHPEHKFPSNERLEFLGDAVLQFLSSDFLYSNYKEAPEGEMTNYRAAIVCTPSLAEEAKRLGYGDLLFLSNGEEVSGGRQREYILANTFEAVLGALFLEKGIEVCRKFVNKNLFYKIAEIVKNSTYKDSKSIFQEIVQEKFNLTPKYDVIDSWGADHNKTFKVGVYVGKELFGEGEGGSKQKAEQGAAQAGLDKAKSL